MDYKYHYYFRFKYTAPGTGKSPIYSAFYVNRCAPMDSRLYYKIRRKAFGAMNSTYWACTVEIYRADECKDPVNIDIYDCHWKYYGSFTFNHYYCMTCFAAHAHGLPGIESHDKSGISCCWNWVNHRVPYDWENHTKYNPSMRT